MCICEISIPCVFSLIFIKFPFHYRCLDAGKDPLQVNKVQQHRHRIQKESIKDFFYWKTRRHGTKLAYISLKLDCGCNKSA